MPEATQPPSAGAAAAGALSAEPASPAANAGAANARARRLAIAVFLGFATALGGLAIDARQALGGLLVAGVFGVTLALGATLLVSIQGAVNARWWFAVRAPALALMRSLWVPAALLALLLAGGAWALYPWAGAGGTEISAAVQAKAPWLNLPAFLARAALVLSLWVWLTRDLTRRIDALPAGGSSIGVWRGAAVRFLVVFAITISVAAWDWGMSLEPGWVSTMYGVGLFAGTLLAGIAGVTVLALCGCRGAPLRDNAVHDLGKLLFAFACFWAYIAFCQYMLIWYANLPEESVYFGVRGRGGWAVAFVLAAALNFVVPFFALASARAKRHRRTVLTVAVLVLVGRGIDVALMIGPTLGAATFAVAALGGTAGLLALMLRTGRTRLLRRAAPSVPSGPAV